MKLKRKPAPSRIDGLLMKPSKFNKSDLQKQSQRLSKNIEMILKI